MKKGVYLNMFSDNASLFYFNGTKMEMDAEICATQISATIEIDTDNVVRIVFHNLIYLGDL